MKVIESLVMLSHYMVRAATHIYAPKESKKSIICLSKFRTLIGWAWVRSEWAIQAIHRDSEKKKKKKKKRTGQIHIHYSFMNFGFVEWSIDIDTVRQFFSLSLILCDSFYRTPVIWGGVGLYEWWEKNLGKIKLMEIMNKATYRKHWGKWNMRKRLLQENVINITFSLKLWYGVGEQ